LLYNIGASAIAMVTSGLFTNEGQISPVPSRMAMGAVFFALAVAGLRRGGATLHVAALLPLTAALMSVMLFRSRNQLIGAAGLAICAGVGLAGLRMVAPPPGWRHAARAALMVLIVLVLARKALDARQRVIDAAIDLNSSDPCESHLRQRPIGRDFAPIVKRHFDMPDPDCRQHTPAS
jgi:hypothetical protein